MSNESMIPNLEELSAEEASDPAEQIMALLAEIGAGMVSMQERLAKTEQGLAFIEGRAMLLEKHVGYLLSKDPVVGPRVVEEARKAKEKMEQAKQNGTQMS